MSAPSELFEHAAALYRGELSQFTAERNRLAAELRAGGRKSLAAAVKALAKPSVSAWAVDQLYWRERPRFDAFLAAAAALRDTLREGAGPSERHVASREHRDAHGELLARAQTILGESGHGVAPALLRRIGTTLEAIATRGWSELGAGCLAEDLDPPGFEDTFALGGFAAAPAKPRAADDDETDAPEPEPEPAPERESAEARRAAKAREAEAKLREAAKKKAEAKKAAIAAARDEAKRTARDLDTRRRDCDEAEAKERDTSDALTELRAELLALQRKVERATGAHAAANTAADACRERRDAAAEAHERATAKLRALQDE